MAAGAWVWTSAATAATQLHFGRVGPLALGAGLVLGARVPIILTSRADSVQSRLASAAVGALVAHRRKIAAPLG